MGRPKLISDAELLAHARAVFTRDGALGSTREIAERAGISEAALFKRHATKAALFLAAMTPPPIDPAAIIGDADTAVDPEQALRGIARRLVGAFRALIPLTMPLIHNPLVDPKIVRRQFGEDAVDALAQALARYLRRQRRRGRVRGNPDTAARLLIAATHSIAQFEVMGLYDGMVGAAGINALVDTLWHGLAPGPAEPQPKTRQHRTR